MAGRPTQPSPPPTRSQLESRRERLTKQQADLSERASQTVTQAGPLGSADIRGTRSTGAFGLERFQRYNPMTNPDPGPKLEETRRQLGQVESQIKDMDARQQQQAGGGVDAAGRAEARRKAALGAQRQAAIRASGRLAGTTGGAEGVTELRRRRDRNSGSASQTLGV